MAISRVGTVAGTVFFVALSAGSAVKTPVLETIVVGDRVERFEGPRGYWQRKTHEEHVGFAGVTAKAVRVATTSGGDTCTTWVTAGSTRV